MSDSQNKTVIGDLVRRAAGRGASFCLGLLWGLALLAAGGRTASAQTISFGKSLLSGTSLTNPTSLQFGPDGRLYVAQQDGTIQIYTVTRSGPNAYVVSATQTITLVRDIPNHNDDGAPNPSVTGRQVTGILVTGTAANPIIYVASSDPRIGAGSGGTDSNLDTNSGRLSRLTWNGSTWAKLDLVRGLPRSEENHASNGLALDPATHTLYLAQGGHTNMGAISNNFALLPEYALSAAILAIDLDAIGDTTYDLPTLDDPAPARNSGTPGVDLDDPFGGNDGANQAKLVPGGPVRVHSPGYRNPYDVVITSAGRMYTIDNGPNSGWGDVPIGEGTSTCTNAVHEPGVTHQDQLHYVTGPGYYGGHPNPTRANTANTFHGESPVTTGNAVECDYRVPGSQDGALALFGSSTNGLTEYRGTNFAGAMTGDLLAASFDNSIQRVKLNAAGTTVTQVGPLFSSVGGLPLDVVAQPDTGPFPGSIWVADYDGPIVVYEPADFFSCTGADNPALDEDADGFNNADEIDNGTNPCSAGDVPPDWDGDHVSNLNDPDDDNDGRPDTSDPFAIDPQNGSTTDLPLLLTWDNDAPRPGKLLNLGFTGVMTNGVANYESLFDAGNMTAGGAAGVCTIDLVPEGDAFSTTNTQMYGLQAGVHVTPATGVFTAHTRVLAPFAGLAPTDFQSMGLFVGTGDQDHYAKLVVSANGGAGGVLFMTEIGSSIASAPQPQVALPGPDAIDLYLTIDAAAATVQPSYVVITNQVPGPLQTIGSPVAIPAAWLAGPDGLAVGLISTSSGPGVPFPATWDFLKVRAGSAVECVDDSGCDDGNLCTTDTCFANSCLHINNSNSCDDGVACTSGDVCTAGSCHGTDACPGGFACTIPPGTCEPINADLDNDGLVGAADPCPTSPLNLCFGPTAIDGSTGKPIRMNAGDGGGECSGSKVDCSGRLWQSDFGYAGNSHTSVCNLGGGGEGCVITGLTEIFGCENEETEDMFQCEHWAPSWEPDELTYSFAVPNGTYLVSFLFANSYDGTTSPGSRVFDIFIEGQLAYDDFDQVIAAGGSGRAVVRAKIVQVTDGTLNILFGHVFENPALKALEVLRQDRDGDGSFPPADCDDLNPSVHPGGNDNNCNGLDEDCDGATDQGYAPIPTACGVGSCARTGATFCAGGAVQNSCVPGAPSSEVCDGADNNCNGVVDDAPPPAGTAGPDLAYNGSSAEALSWPVVASATTYDLLRGDLQTLRTSGLAAAVQTCLANDAAAVSFDDPAVPEVESGFFYLVRASNCGGHGTWDSGGAGQAAPRDPPLAQSPLACP